VAERVAHDGDGLVGGALAERGGHLGERDELALPDRRATDEELVDLLVGE
jgi:hypothetical protein